MLSQTPPKDEQLCDAWPDAIVSHSVPGQFRNWQAADEYLIQQRGAAMHDGKPRVLVWPMDARGFPVHTTTAENTADMVIKLSPARVTKVRSMRESMATALLIGEE